MKKVLIIGFGNVGRALSHILPADMRVIGLFTGRHGSIVNEGGIDLAELNKIMENGGAFPGAEGGPDALVACRELDYDVMVELSTLKIGERGEPAASHIRAALLRGRDAVTANKGPIAFCYPELKAVADSRCAKLRFESTVMDGAPLLNMAERCLKGNRITAFSGILNGTTNYILSRMELGETFDSAVAGAVAAGVAEADPANDVDGWDAAAKTSVLARVLLGASLSPLDVERKGIRGITVEKAEDAVWRGFKLKLVCRGWKQGARVRASVGVEELPLNSHFANIGDFGAGVCIESELMAPIYVIQSEPTPLDTAYGVLEDLLSL